MIQDIAPSKMDNSFKNYHIREEDNLIIFDKEGKAYVQEKNGKVAFASGANIKEEEATYLFSVDDKRYFLDAEDIDFDKYLAEGFNFYTIREVRDRFSGVDDVNVFVTFTAYHLWKWYSDNRFCGKCGKPFSRGDKERSLICPECGNVIYPRINPAVIVGVTRGDSILLTRYRRGYAHNALVAGFTEIGETLEETVAREVMEETGVKVKNIRYYKSQPWGMAQDMLVGFYCDADGDGEIHMDADELKYAEWVKREDIELQPNNLSLTNEMMRMFKEGKR
ncbi:NAD+ diphosphatase [Lachnospiraceae bacterium NE2001]|nr:NAD+ diphosphatase [Lachnospiraceae bacterium NE2001]